MEGILDTIGWAGNHGRLLSRVRSMITAMFWGDQSSGKSEGLGSQGVRKRGPNRRPFWLFRGRDVEGDSWKMVLKQMLFSFFY